MDRYYVCSTIRVFHWRNESKMQYKPCMDKHRYRMDRYNRNDYLVSLRKIFRQSNQLHGNTSTRILTYNRRWDVIAVFIWQASQAGKTCKLDALDTAKKERCVRPLNFYCT